MLQLVQTLEPDTTRPSVFLYQFVRARFVLKGTTLNAWCIDNKVTREWAAQCLSGRRTGPAAKALVQRLLAASV
jgi:hypothetical protein